MSDLHSPMMELWSFCNFNATKRSALAACLLTCLTVSSGFAQAWTQYDSNWVPVKVRQKSVDKVEEASPTSSMITSADANENSNANSKTNATDSATANVTAIETTPVETSFPALQWVSAEEESVNTVDFEVNEIAPPPPESEIEEPATTEIPAPAPFPVILAESENGCLGQECNSSCTPESGCQTAATECDVDNSLLLDDQSLCQMRGPSDQFEAPASRRWIFWKDECQTSEPGPICCSLQERMVNWRLSSMYLEGCMPEGYSLSCFIETVSHVEFHGTPLASNGPADPGGSFADAQVTEGKNVKTLQQISINITPPPGKLPPDRAAERFKKLTAQAHIPGTHRLWNGTSFYWDASLLNHQPLYFEDVNLERHGFSHGCWQPFVSGAKFFSRIPALPYLMTAEPPQETHYTLGESRPGNHACYVCERPPFSWKAVVVQGAATTGLVFLIP
ncbi:hypothetical protein [Thalassoglobus polymorphus]|uniref:Uncharacterized protein n=1 Tax=Thalassoglobus polymorphus TaxID=2527994 RepID=A0A517QHI8_9PLAN|nr:hypothetical protein [Thalassoglobus polymorphus]QDT31091.1 hypothetical protein Mal48_03220 [Thalassoglobus polymorphus]